MNRRMRTRMSGGVREVPGNRAPISMRWLSAGIGACQRCSRNTEATSGYEDRITHFNGDGRVKRRIIMSPTKVDVNADLEALSG
jgi:hypothetical protein